MLFEEADVDFGKLDASQFEELCFDLLSEAGFYDLCWRQGGADSGRDIEALLAVDNLLVGHYAETWFVECKNHSSGLGVADPVSYTHLRAHET